MTYKEIYDFINRELFKNGITSCVQCHEAGISLLYLSVFSHTSEPADAAKQILNAYQVSFDLIESIRPEIEKLSDEDMRKLIILFNERLAEYNTDFSNKLISDLAIRLLDPVHGDLIFDFGCSYGSFLTYAIDYCKDNNIEIMQYTGVDMNINATNIAKMITMLLKAPGYFSVGDYLSDSAWGFSKGFVFPPLGKFLSTTGRYKSVVFDGLTLSHNSQGWLYVDRIIPFLGEERRIVAVLPASALFSSNTEEYRKELLKKGYIEGIVELPAGFIYRTSVKMAMVVLSTDNTHVKFVKAEDNNSKNVKRQNNKNLDIDRIIEDYQNKAEDYYPVEELLTLNTLQYSAISNKTNNVKDGKKLGEVAEVITGAQYTISKFTDSLSVKPTERQIVVSSDIEDGVVDWDSLPYIYGFEHFDKYSVKEGDLIMTSKSSKVKIAYVDIKSKNKIIVTSGMLIIRPSKELDGMFLKIYLDSEEGQRALRSVQKGNIITSINAKDLREILVPVPSKRHQKELSKEYNNKLSTLIALKEEVRKLENQLKDFYKKEADY